MLENCGVSASFARSQELVRGYGWSVFGVIILTVLIFIGVGIVFAILEGVLDSRWLSFALNIVLQTVTAPFLALAWTITYYELRDLKGAELDRSRLSSGFVSELDKETQRPDRGSGLRAGGGRDPPDAR